MREIGEAVGLSSSSTVHAHLAALQDKGYLRRDPTKPRALEVRSTSSPAPPIERRPVRHVPLVGDVAAGTGVLAAENIEETLPVPEDFTGDGELFMLRVRGDSMIDAGIFDGDYVVVRQQPDAEPGDTVVAGIPGEEATVKTFLRRRNKIVLRPENSDDGRDGLRPRRRHDLRQGRLAAPPALSPTERRRRIAARVRVVALTGSPRCARARDHRVRS